MKLVSVVSNRGSKSKVGNSLLCLLEPFAFCNTSHESFFPKLVSLQSSTLYYSVQIPSRLNLFSKKEFNDVFLQTVHRSHPFLSGVGVLPPGQAFTTIAGVGLCIPNPGAKCWGCQHCFLWNVLRFKIMNEWIQQNVNYSITFWEKLLN